MSELEELGIGYWGLGIFFSYTNSINDCNKSLGEDAMNRVSTDNSFVPFFFQIGIIFLACTFPWLLVPSP